MTVVQKMANYEEARSELTYARLINLKSTARNKAGTTLRMKNKNFQDE